MRFFTNQGRHTIDVLFGQKEVRLEILYFKTFGRFVCVSFASFLWENRSEGCQLSTSPFCDSLPSSETPPITITFQQNSDVKLKLPPLQPARPHQLLSDPFPPYTSMQTTNQQGLVCSVRKSASQFGIPTFKFPP